MIALYLPKYGVPLSDPCCYPLGFMYVSAILKAAGHKVKVLNCNLWDYDLDEELKGITDVMFTGFEEFLPEILRVANICHEKGIKTHIGGALATFAPEKLQGKINCVYSGEFCPQMSIDASPWPDYDGFGVEEYHHRHDYRYMGVLTSRGCPHKCTFCSSVCRYRCRSMETVENEIDYYIKDHRIELLVVNDNTLNASLGRFRRFCAMMKGKGIGWSAALRLDNLDDTTVAAAKASGLCYAVVGVESFQQSKLDAMQKGITVAQIETSLELLEKHKIKYHGNVIMGFEGETDAQIRAEFEDMRSRPWRVFPVYLQKFIGITATTVNITNYAELFRQYIYDRDMYCYPEVVR